MPIEEEEDITKDDDEISTCDISTCDPSDSESGESAEDAPVPRRPPGLMPPPGLLPPPPGVLELNREDEAARIKAENLAQRLEAAKARLANANAWLVQSQHGAGPASAYNPQGVTGHSVANAGAYNPHVAWCDPQAAWYYQNNMNWGCQSAWTGSNWPVQSFA